MKYLLLLAIRIYWKLPTRLHQRCIFRETCSHYVYRIASTQGLWAGIQAIKLRFKLCRPGYVVYKSEGRYYLKTANGVIIEEEDIAPSELPPICNNILDLDDSSYIVSHAANPKTHWCIKKKRFMHSHVATYDD